ncbi:MAG: F-type H+-transporting ATPase subunit epsilon [Candidatus Azotimanducaceae bacterium]|jgi:F-type H+-transporting ATPase subunit epsilon
MASTVLCSIVSAELEIFSGQVQMVVATGTMGELGIFPGHTPLLTGVMPGPIRLKLENGEEETFFASGGYLEVQPTSITVLADTALRADDLDEAAALAAQQKAERELSDNKSSIDFGRVQADIRETAAMLRTIRRYRK